MQDAAQVSWCDVIELAELAEREIGILFQAFVHAVGFCKKLRQRRYDVVIFLMHKIRSAAWLFLADFDRNYYVLLQRFHDVSPFKTVQLAVD